MSPPVPMVSKQDVSILLPYLGFQSLALNVVNVILIFLTLHIQGYIRFNVIVFIISTWCIDSNLRNEQYVLFVVMQ